MINGVSPDGDWKRNFRMSREEFLELCEELRPHISPCINSPNYLTLSLEKKVAVALYYLKDTGSIWMTANTFGIHQCTVSKVILQFCNAVTTHLGPKYLHLPRTVDEMQTTVAEFETKFGMTQAFGCVDGTYVPIRPKTTSITSSFIPSVLRQFVMLKAYSWMLIAGGLGVSMMLRFFQTLW